MYYILFTVSWNHDEIDSKVFQVKFFLILISRASLHLCRNESNFYWDLTGAGAAQWSRSWLRLTRSSAQKSAKKNCVVLRDYQLSVLSSGCVIRIPPRPHSTGSEDCTCLLLEKGDSIMHIVIHSWMKYITLSPLW